MDELPPKGAPKGSPKVKPFFYLIELVESIEGHIVISLNILFLRNKIGFKSMQVVTLTHSADMINLFLAPIGALVIDSGGNKYIIMILFYIRNIIIETFIVTTSLPQLRHIARSLIYARYSIGVLLNIIVCSVVEPFHGDQFKLPAEKDEFKNFLRLLYILHKIGIIVGFIVGPAVKTYIACLGEQDCYLFSFSISFILSILALIIFLAGTKFYINNKPERNIALDIIKCSSYAFSHWIRERRANPQPHWLDHAEPKYGGELIKEIKQLGRMILIFTAVPLYEALYCQLDSEWLFQAARLDGRIGKFTIIPEYFYLMHPILGIILIPLLTRFFDPFLERINMGKTFRRMIFGGLMTVLAFVAAGLLETTVKQTEPVVPKSKESQIRIYNSFDCSCFVTSSGILPSLIDIGPHSVYTNLHIPVKAFESFTIAVNGECLTSGEHDIYLEPKKAISVHIADDNGEASVSSFETTVKKSETGLPVITVLGARREDVLILRDSKDSEIHLNVEPIWVAGVPVLSGSNRVVEAEPEFYTLLLNGDDLYNFDMHLGGIYLAIINGDSVDFFTITEPNTVHMLWMIPQSILLVFGEVYFGITLHEFTYSEAPKSLKTFINALLHFALGLGHLFLITIVNLIHMDLDYEFYFFAVVLLVNMFYFTILAFFYKSMFTDEKLI